MFFLTSCGPANTAVRSPTACMRNGSTAALVGNGRDGTGQYRQDPLSGSSWPLDVGTSISSNWQQPEFVSIDNGEFGLIRISNSIEAVFGGVYFNRFGTCCGGDQRGNVNGDYPESINIIDMTMLAAYLFTGGGAPTASRKPT